MKYSDSISLRMKRPLPAISLRFESMGKSDRRHRDAFGRVHYIKKGDVTYEHFLRPEDGRIVPLLVQESHEETTIENLTPKQKTWVTTGEPELRVPAILRVVHWTFSSILQEGSEDRHYGAIPVIMVLLKWIPACLLLTVLVSNQVPIVPLMACSLFLDTGIPKH